MDDSGAEGARASNIPVFAVEPAEVASEMMPQHPTMAAIVLDGLAMLREFTCRACPIRSQAPNEAWRDAGCLLRRLTLTASPTLDEVKSLLEPWVDAVHIRRRIEAGTCILIAEDVAAAATASPRF